MKLTLFIATLALASCKPAEEETVTQPPADPSLAAGDKIYHNECAMCHEEGEEGAPRLSNAAEWKKRAAKGLPTLLDHAINGYQGSEGKMPPRGGTETLTDQEVTDAVNYMLSTLK